MGATKIKKEKKQVVGKKNSEKKEGVFNAEVSIGGVRAVDKAIFAKNMAVMLRSGLAINEALRISLEQTKGKLKKVVKSILGNVESGNSFSIALANHPKIFSGMFIQIVNAGEKSGTLDASLDNIALQLEKQHQLNSKIKGAMVYPVVILIATFILGLFMAFFVLPKITPLFKGLNIELPWTTRALIAMSELIQAHGLLLAVSIFAGVTILTWIAQQKFSQPVTHWLLIHTPILGGVTKNANLARFTSTLGVLLKSGIVIEDALVITQSTVDNYYYRKAIEKSITRVTTGIQVSRAIAEYTSLFPIILVEMIHVGEESGNLEETLLYLSSYYDLEVDTATKSLTTVIEPVLLLLIGGAVGVLALSIITPIYQITGNIGR